MGCVGGISWGGGLQPNFKALESQEKENFLRRQRQLPEKEQDKNAFLYSAKFTHDHQYIVAGGAGKNEVRVFRAEDGAKVCTISDNTGAVLSLDTGKKTNKFTFSASEKEIWFMEITDEEIEIPEVESQSEPLAAVSQNTMSQRNEDVETPSGFSNQMQAEFK